MEYRILGDTGIKISAISFGAGPVSALMTNSVKDAVQRKTIRKAIDNGINWFDTAATYGDGSSEKNLGIIFKEMNLLNRIHVATKVRLMPEQLDNIVENVKKSVRMSLKRLRMEKVSLIQLHNAITQNRDDQYTSITPQDVLGKKGVLEAFQMLKSERLVQHIGLTGLGDIPSLLQVVRSGAFDTIQVCYNILNPSAGKIMPEDFDGIDYGNIITECRNQGMGVIAIRILAGGALAGNPPSEYTLKAKVFPLHLYERDMKRTKNLAKLLPSDISLKEAAVRFVLSNSNISSALVGFSNPAQLDEIIRFSSAGQLDEHIIESITNSTLLD